MSEGLKRRKINKRWYTRLANPPGAGRMLRSTFSVRRDVRADVIRIGRTWWIKESVLLLCVLCSPVMADESDRITALEKQVAKIVRQLDNWHWYTAHQRLNLNDQYEITQPAGLRDGDEPFGRSDPVPASGRGHLACQNCGAAMAGFRQVCRGCYP